MATTLIRVPCSSANIGPGYDVIGLALSEYLELRVTVNDEQSKEAPQNCRITQEGLGADQVDLDASRHFITRIALYVLRCHDQRSFPSPTHVHINNAIPFGRGLGSSGAAIVAGVALGNVVGNLKLDKDRLLDFCLMIEKHPDNVAASMYGGFVGSYTKKLDPVDVKRREVPMSEVLPMPQGGEDTGLKPPVPPHNIAKHIRFPWAKEIKCIAIIPDFEVATAKAREAVPGAYTKEDAIFNLQRVALLTTALGQSPPNAELIYDGMQDRLHQPYRQGLIPGLTEILKSVTPDSHPGLLGICLSGAGPTILALATENFDQIATHLLNQFKQENITCTWKLLEPAFDGLTVTSSDSPSPKQQQQQPQPNGMTYADAGVSIDAGNSFVQLIKPSVKATRRPGTDALIGGFGGVFDLSAAGFGPNAPILVQAIDGVGTKLKIAFEMEQFHSVGIDLVAMNVNDLVVQGAEPITFMDYYATSKLIPADAAAFIKGVADGCIQAGAALVGGETAEMPGMYSGKDFDAGGAATGVIRQGQKVLPDIDAMREGDILLGLPSSGVHSNGFSLVRKILERHNLSFHDPAPWTTSSSSENVSSIGESLLTPTKIYVKPLLSAIAQNLLLGMAHITGGGLEDNIPRMLPSHLAAELSASTWPVPSVMQWLKRAGGVSSREFARTWNTGLGMVIVVTEQNVDEAVRVLKEAGEEEVYRVGRLVKREEGEKGEGVVLRDFEHWDQ